MRPIVILFSLVACAGDVSTNPITPTTPATPATADTGDPVPTPPEPTLAAEGLYETVFDGVVDNTCGTLADSLSPAPWTLIWQNDTTFAMLDVTMCTVTGTAVECAEEEAPVPLDAETTIRFLTDRTGEILDEETIALDLDMTVECDGPGCLDFANQLGATLPCGLVLQTTSFWLGE